MSPESLTGSTSWALIKLYFDWLASYEGTFAYIFPRKESTQAGLELTMYTRLASLVVLPRLPRCWNFKTCIIMPSKLHIVPDALRDFNRRQLSF